MGDSATATTLGLEQARASLPALVDAVRGGAKRVITKHGKPVAALVPLSHLTQPGKAEPSLTRLRGSGRGMWAKDVGRMIDLLRDEWA
jgi:prevent-host-death family protein